MILLIHPETGAVASVSRDDKNPRQLFEALVLAGYRPVGPRGQAEAAKIE